MALVAGAGGIARSHNECRGTAPAPPSHDASRSAARSWRLSNQDGPSKINDASDRLAALQRAQSVPLAELTGLMAAVGEAV